MKKYLVYFVIGFLIGAIIALLDGCCPGARNLTSPQSRTAFDFMNYECDKQCVLSKMDRYTESGGSEWECVINGNDEVIVSFDGQAFDYFRLLHTGNKEKSNELWQWYIAKFKNYPNFKTTTDQSFAVTYYRWNVRVNLTSFGTQVTASKI